MKAKRKRVPAALHSELTEYSSLIRALRTSNTLDVTSQLARYHKKFTDVDDNDEENYNEDDEDTGSPVAGPSNYQNLPTPDHSQNSRKRKRYSSTASASLSRPASPSVASTQSKIRSKKQKKDTWTRWPLLPEDVPVPKWNFEDEVAIIAKQVLNGKQSHSPTPNLNTYPSSPTKLLPPPTSSPQFSSPLAHSSRSSSLHIDADDNDTNFDDEEDEIDDDDDDEEQSSYITALTHSTELYLHHILASIASIIPVRPASMQNRIKPIDWETVLEALIACGTPGGSTGVVGDAETSTPETGVPANVLNKVRERMEAIYGPSKSRKSAPNPGARPKEDDPNNRMDVDADTDPTQVQVAFSDGLGSIRVISTPHGPEQSQVENVPGSGIHGSGSSQPYPIPLTQPEGSLPPQSSQPGPPTRSSLLLSTPRTPSSSQSHFPRQSDPPLSPSSLTTHRLNAFLASKRRLSETLARYGATEDVLHASDDLEEESARVQLDKKTMNSLYKIQARRNMKKVRRNRNGSVDGDRVEADAEQRVPGSGDEAEISLGTGNDEGSHGDVDGAIIHSRPKRKAKSLGEVSLALSAKRKQKPRGRPFTKRNKVEPQEEEYGEEVEVVEGELELVEESSEEAEASTSFQTHRRKEREG